MKGSRSSKPAASVGAGEAKKTMPISEHIRIERTHVLSIAALVESIIAENLVPASAGDSEHSRAHFVLRVVLNELQIAADRLQRIGLEVESKLRAVESHHQAHSGSS